MLLLVDYRLAIGRIITVKRDILLTLSLKIFEFCENKGSNSGSVNNATMDSAPAPAPNPAQPSNNGNDFFPIDDSADDDILPF